MSLQPFSAADVTVIVPVGGSAPAWQRCALSLARLDPPPAEIIVVIDGPHGDLATPAADFASQIEVLERQSGPAVARNRGAELASSSILFFVDSDIELPPDIAARVAELFTADPEMTAVIGSYDQDPGDPGFLSQYRNLLHHFVHQTGRELASTFWSGCGAIRRQAFQEMAGFDESYAEPSIEDIELGARLRQAGHTIRLAKDLQVKHLKTWRLMNMLSTDLWRRAVPWTELMLRDGQLVNDLNVKTRDRVNVVLAFLALLGIAAAGWWLPGLALAAIAMLLIVLLNASMFGFFAQHRGVGFMLRVIPFYGIYLLICGLGFALGLLRHLRRS